MLERIEIENLGAIEKTALSLSPLTVLVGANASGKTTVMRGIELFAALLSESLTDVTFAGHALTGDQWPVLLHGGDETKQLVLRAFISQGSAEPDYELRLGINWEHVSASIVEQAGSGLMEPEFLFERLRDARGGWHQADSGPYAVPGVGQVSQRQASVANTLRRLGNVPIFRERLKEVVQFLESFGTARYFRPNGAAMLVPTEDGKVLPTGEGFVAALATLQNREVERFEAIEKNLCQLFPHIRRIRFDIGRDGSMRHLVFETDRSKRLTPADLEADGVLTTLFLLWAGATTPPHGTLLLDEPEAALHPHLMGKRVEFLRSLAQGSFTGSPLKVVIATQSVDFVRWLELPEIRLVEYSRETGTRVHALPESETLSTLVEKFQANLGDLWFSGALGGVPGTGA
jgi:predicted ATPase